VNQQSLADTALAVLNLTSGGSARLDLEDIQTLSSKLAKVVFKGTPSQSVAVGFGCNNIRLEGSVILHIQWILSQSPLLLHANSNLRASM
jgi:hypothetical protein